MSEDHDLDIPDFLRATGTPEERMAAWTEAFNKTGRAVVASARFVPDMKKTVDPETVAFLAKMQEDEKMRARNRIHKMKTKKSADPKVMSWDFKRGGYFWNDTHARVTFRPDGTPVPQGSTLPSATPVVEAKRENEDLAMQDMLASLNRHRADKGEAPLKVWKGSTSELVARIERYSPAKTSAAPAAIAAAAEAEAPRRQAPEPERAKTARGRMWKTMPATANPREFKPIHAGTKRHSALIMMAEGKHTVDAISEAIGANAIAHAFCLERDSGIGYKFVDPKTGEDLPVGNSKAIIVALWPTGKSLADAVREKGKKH